LKRNLSTLSGAWGTLSERLHSLRSSVAFRLALLFAGILTVTYFAAFCVFDLGLGSGVQDIPSHAAEELLELILVVLFSCFLGWFMARRALSTVGELARTTKAIANGALDSRVPVKGSKDELDELAATFNSMVERIQRLIRGVKEVTDNIAHDLRSPVARMRGLAEVTLTSRGSADEYEATLERIVEQCDRLLGMINAMLEISEAEAGTVQLRLEEVDIAEVASYACQLFQAAAEDKGVAIAVQAPAPACLYGDLQKLQRVLANLLDNAVKYTQVGGQITISVRDDDSQVAVAVRDTGIGIAEEDLPHIFDRFYRAEKSRSEPGSGLGLSLAKAFISAHEGRITVSSWTGKGSEFVVTLPKSNRKNATRPQHYHF